MSHTVMGIGGRAGGVRYADGDGAECGRRSWSWRHVRCSPQSSSTTPRTAGRRSDRPAPGDRPGEYEWRSRDDHVRQTVFNTARTIHLDPALGQLEPNDHDGTETITGLTRA